jgi:hypothetical protein
MEITLTIPDSIISEVFEGEVSGDEVAKWVKRKISFELFHSKLTDRKIRLNKESSEQQATHKGCNGQVNK